MLISRIQFPCLILRLPGSRMFPLHPVQVFLRTLEQSFKTPGIERNFSFWHQSFQFFSNCYKIWTASYRSQLHSSLRSTALCEPLGIEKFCEEVSKTADHGSRNPSLSRHCRVPLSIRKWWIIPRRTFEACPVFTLEKTVITQEVPKFCEVTARSVPHPSNASLIKGYQQGTVYLNKSGELGHSSIMPLPMTK